MRLPLAGRPSLVEELLRNPDDGALDELQRDRRDFFRKRRGTLSMADSRSGKGMTSDRSRGGWATTWMTARVMTPRVPSDPMRR
ncbi:MAG TPA: hypothetical protein PLX50_09555 [Candidatus Aminicenantes bacterium]|nr:hypothetical protein [Candidatus Aminicenantes bacterium]